MAKLSRRHHYLPQFYLQRFTADDGLLSVFDRETKEFRRQSPVNTALRRDFYTLTDKQGVKTDILEQMLSEAESGAKAFLQRVDSGLPAWEDQGDRATFALFLALLYARTPSFHEEQTDSAERLFRMVNRSLHPSPEATAQALREYERVTGVDMSDVDPEYVFQMVWNDRYDVKVSRGHTLRVMAETAPDLAQVLIRLNWTFARAPEHFAFITSDAPFVISPPPGRADPCGVLTPGAATIVPLSPRLCIVIRGDGGQDQYDRIPKGRVRAINEIVAKNSARFIIGRNQAYLQRLVKCTRVDQGRWTSRSDFAEFELEEGLLLRSRRGQPPER